MGGIMTTYPVLVAQSCSTLCDPMDWSLPGFSWGSAGKEPACNVGDLGSIPGLRRFAGEGKGYPLQYSGLENSMDCIVHGVTKSWTQLSDFHFHYLSGIYLNSLSHFKFMFY